MEKKVEGGLSRSELGLDPAQLESVVDEKAEQAAQLAEIPDEVTHEENQRTLRKIDWCLMPIMGICYALQYLDKAALSQSTLLGIKDVGNGGLGLHGSQFSWCTSIFYFGYLAFSAPSSYFIVRFPIGKYIALVVTVWGGILMCTAGCKSFSGLMAQRFFLGVAEAAVAPGFSLLTGMFYTRKEQPMRQAAWFLGNCIAIIVGGLIAYGVGTIDNPALPRWKILFLIEGSITCAYGLTMFITLPDSVGTAWFLNEDQRRIAIARTVKNNTGDVFEDHVFRWPQVWDSLSDPQVLLLILYTISNHMTTGALTAFQPQIIKGLGFTDLDSILLQLPNGGAEILFMVVTCALASHVPNVRLLMMSFNVAISMVGIIIVFYVETQATRMVGLVISVISAVNIPLAVSVVTSNIAGFTKRSVTSAAIFVAYCVGNIIGPQFYSDTQSPAYRMGLKSTIAAFAFAMFFLLCLLVYYVYENRRRDRVNGPTAAAVDGVEAPMLSTAETDRTIPSFRYVM